MPFTYDNMIAALWGVNISKVEPSEKEKQPHKIFKDFKDAGFIVSHVTNYCFSEVVDFLDLENSKLVANIADHEA